MCDKWLNKYEPNNLDDFNNFKNNEIKIIQDFILNYKSKPFPNIIISGLHGVGKSILIKLIIKNLNYNSKIINYNNEKKTNIINELINNNNNNNNILIINDIDKFTLKKEKILIFNLIKNNNINKYLPIIFISNKFQNKILSELNEYCIKYIINEPSKKELNFIINKILKNENMEIEQSVIEIIIKFCQNDIRKLISTLYDIKVSFNNNYISVNDINKFLISSYEKTKEISLFDSSKYIINKLNNLNTILYYYKIDKVLIPLTIHENYYKSLINKKIDFNDKIYCFKQISNSMSIGDVIETNIYTDQNWYLHDIHGYYTCYRTSFFNNNFNDQIINYEMKFSSDLNQTSLKNINRKQISNINKILKDKSITDIINMSYIIYELVKNDKINDLFNIMKDYQNSLKLIETFIKIDKNFNKIAISQKSKKSYNLLLKNYKSLS